MEISKPQIIHSDDIVKYQADVIFGDQKKVLWYSVDKEFEYLLSRKSDAAALALLIPAMIAGKDLYIRGVISQKLLYNLSGPLQNVLKIIMPKLNYVDIQAESVCTDNKPADGVATGFSAGIDSYQTLFDHYYQKKKTSLEITHLLFNNVGQHKDSKKLFQNRFSEIKPLADKIGLPLVKVDSNLGQFYMINRGYHFRRTHTFRNTSVPLLLQNGIGRFLYSSDLSYEHVSLNNSKKRFSSSYSDAISLPLMSTGTLDTILSGANLTRIEKTINVSQVNISHDSLSVCLDKHDNCSKCRKCLRTLLTLEIEGKIRDYSNVFDLELYSRYRTEFIAKALSDNHPYYTELRSFIKERKFNIPFASRLLAVLFLFMPFNQINRIKRISKRLRIQKSLRFS